MQIQVQYFQRKASPTNFSLERAFRTIRTALPKDICVEVYNCQFHSRRIVRRILNIIGARFHQDDLNHIVGDVHYLALGLSKRRTILTIHDCVCLRNNKGLHHIILRWFWYWLPVRRVAAVTVISEFTRDEVLKCTGCNPDIVHVIPDPVPIEFSPYPKVFDQKYPVILQVGTSQHNKNICRVAEALRGIPCHLEIIGQLTELQREALTHNSISYREQWSLSDEQVVAKYQECDMVIFVSLYEGFGMPIVEANATGRPVVTSNIAPMSSVAGAAACLVDPFSPSSIREGVLRVINDSTYRSYLITQGFQNIKRFHAEVVAAQYANLYRQLTVKQ